MKFLQAMANADELRPNQISDEMKASWLQRLDEEIGEMMHKSPADIWPEDRPLLMYSPYDDIYELMLCAKIDYQQGETDLYINDTEVYNKRLAEARAHYRRHNVPEPSGNWKVGL